MTNPALTAARLTAIASFSHEFAGETEEQATFSLDADVHATAIFAYFEKVLGQAAALSLDVDCADELRLESLHFEDELGNEFVI